MYSKNIQNVVGVIVIAVAAISSSIFADGSIMVYNNSLYKVNVVVTTQNATQAAATPAEFSYIATTPPMVAAPTNADGTLVVHPTDTNYAAGSNVPMGTVSNVLFTDSVKDFNLQVLDTAGAVVTQINVGTTLGTVVDADPARAVYIYSNVDAAGNTVANSGVSVYFWDAQHSLATPSVQTFIPTA